MESIQLAWGKNGSRSRDLLSIKLRYAENWELDVDHNQKPQHRKLKGWVGQRTLMDMTK